MSLNLRDLVNNYDFTCVLPGSGEEIHFKPLTTGQMKKMLVYEKEDNPFTIETILDGIISECVLNDDFDINKLYLQDRFYLFLKIREKSKGAIYKFMFKCPHCDHQEAGSIDITKMEVKEFNEDKTPIQVADNISVVMKHITRGEQKKVYNSIRKLKGLNKQQQLVEASTQSIALSMEKFISGDTEDDNVPFEDKLYLLNDCMTIETFDRIKQWFEDNNFGIIFKKNIKCNKCEEDVEFDIPMNNFFD